MRQITAERGGHVRDGAGGSFFVAFALDSQQGIAVGLLGGEDDGQLAALQSRLGQSTAHAFAQTAVVGLPNVGELYARNVGLGASAHRGDDTHALFQAGGEQGDFGLNGIYGVDDKVEVTVGNELCGALGGQKFKEYFFANCKCDKIKAAVEKIIG